MKKLVKKTLALAFIASILFVSCTSDENITKQEDATPVKKEEQQYKFSKRVVINDKTGNYNVVVMLSSNNEELIANFLEEKPTIALLKESEADKSSTAAMDNTNTNSKKTDTNQEELPELVIQFLSKNIPDGSIMKFESNNPVVRNARAQTSNLRSNYNLSFQDDDASHILIKNLKDTAHLVRWNLYFGHVIPSNYGGATRYYTQAGVTSGLRNFEVSDSFSRSYAPQGSLRGLKVMASVTNNDTAFTYSIWFLSIQNLSPTPIQVFQSTIN